jgi:hypothetical protein
MKTQTRAALMARGEFARHIRGLVLGFAAFDEAEIAEGVQKLTRAWR